MNWVSSLVSNLGSVIPYSHVASSLLVPAVTKLVQGQQTKTGFAGMLGDAASSLFGAIMPGSKSNTTLDAVQKAMPSLKEVAVSVIVPTLIKAAQTKLEPYTSNSGKTDNEEAPYKYISSAPASVQAGTTYTFVNVRGGTAMDVSDGTLAIIGYIPLKTSSQQWTLEEAGKDLYFLKNGAGLYLSIVDKALNGASVVATNKHHPWSISADDIDKSCIRIYYPGSSLNLELTNRGDKQAGTPVKLGRASPGDFQVWKAEEMGLTPKQ